MIYFFEIKIWPSSLRGDFVHNRELSQIDCNLSILLSAYDFILPVPGKPKQFFETSTLVYIFEYIIFGFSWPSSGLYANIFVHI